MTKKIFRVSVGGDAVTGELVFSDATMARFIEYVSKRATISGYMFDGRLYAGLLECKGREYRFVFAEVPDAGASALSLRAEEDLPDKVIEDAMAELLTATGSREKEVSDAIAKHYERAIDRNFLMQNAKAG